MENYLKIEFEESKNDDLLNLVGEVYDGNDTDILDELSEEDFLDYAVLELSTFPTELTISCGMTRQKQQFMPNTYHASIKIDIENSANHIVDAVRDAAPGIRVEKYIKLKKYMYKSLLSKIDKHEGMLRQALIKRAKEDGTALPND